ncbi:hypothetical protein [Acidianus manzaensis]|uniref:Uncharacterized protein n=1 Tax=Acidianus manzaensis TaxID=282676 RepID=A0A1W6JZM0_9CREN|nr:hypothetical protein [Acidianus manzaensis]ARM75709.1 hypothetical protein B6F84_06425 [Acidianus manzaensis]
MYKVIFKVNANLREDSTKMLRRLGFIVIFKRTQQNQEYYTTLFKGNEISEVKEAISEASFYFEKQGKIGGSDFAKIYEIDDKYLGKTIGGLLGAGIGYNLGGIAGLILGALGGVIIGELADINMGEKYIGVMEWPMLKY